MSVIKCNETLKGSEKSLFSTADQTCVDEIPFWVHCSESFIPEGALKAGRLGGEVLYIGRAMHNRALTPGESDNHSDLSLQ